DAAELEVAERLPGGETGLVLLPGAGERPHVGKLPARLADGAVGRVAGKVVVPARQVCKAQVLVLLPVPVRRKLGKTAEKGFALAQVRLDALALGDVVEKDSDAPQLRVFEAKRVNVVPASELPRFVFKAHGLARQRDP